jgi:translation initiation factor IF-2
LSVRVYALAKQLNIDSKVILDVIKSAGIEGKGTSLSSLLPEEVRLVKAKMDIQKPVKKENEAVFVRPQPLSESRVRNLDAKSLIGKKTEDAGKIPPLDPVAEPVKEQPKVLPQSAPEKPDGSENAESKFVKPVVVKKPAGPVKVLPPPKKEKPPEPKKEDSVPAEEPKQKYALPPALGKMDLPAGTRGGWAGKRDQVRRKQEQPKKDDIPHKPQRSSVPPQPLTTGYSQQGYAADVRRQDHVGPMRRIAERVANRDNDNKREGERQRAAPGGFLLASAPQHTQLKQRKMSEPVPMKPDAKLPVELLKSNNSAELVKAHIRNHAEKQKRKEIERKSLEGKGRSKIKPIGRVDSDVNAVFEANKKKRFKANRRGRNENEDGEIISPRSLQRKRNRGRSLVNTAAPRKSDIVIQLPCSVKQFAETTGLSLTMVLRKLLEIGTLANVNSQLNQESAELLTTSFDLPATVRSEFTLEDQLVAAVEEETDLPETLKSRPPVVTVLGHVDHGKTTLLDYILHLNVVSGEKGGITQHIRAYRVKMDNGLDITFVDTPGHEAFTEMRARGANCTDIVILVVAADDGVMPQTEEAISHAKAAGVPIVVALNKMDLPGINEDRIIQELAQHDLMPSEWGGDTEVIRCSALTGMGVDKLLETVQLIAEMNELKANPDRKAAGMTLEAELQAGQGVVAKVLVQNGTLCIGDVVLCGTAYGKVRAMYDTLDTNKIIESAAPSTPVNLIGLDAAPQAGSRFVVLDDISDARRIAEERHREEHNNELADGHSHVTLENLFQRITQTQTVQMLNVIIRADVRGSIEAIRKELGKLEHPEVKIKILQASVGGITEGDVQLAAASDAIVVGFNVVPDENARVLADKKKVQIRRYEIIYNLTDDIKKALEGMLKPIEQVKELGRVLVQQIFVISRVGTIAGCRVISGTIERDSKMRIIRESRIIGEYPLDSLKREKDDVKDIREGYECGIKLKGFNDIKEGDVLEAFKIEEVARTF